MAKYKGREGKFCQVYWRGLEKLNLHNKKIPYSARWLYAHLHLLEHQYYGKDINGFFRSIDDLQKDMKMGRKQVIKGIKILEKLNLIETFQMHWINKKTKKKSEKHITAFRILEPLL